MSKHISTKEAARILNVHQTTVLKNIESGRLKAEAVGTGRRKIWLVDLESVIEWKRSPAGKKEKVKEEGEEK